MTESNSNKGPSGDTDKPVQRHYKALRRRKPRKTVEPEMSAGDVQILADLKDSIDQLPEIDATRVVALHNQIIAGEYQVNLERLTDRLMAFEQELQGKD